MSRSDRWLDGVLVLDLSRVLAGPLCTMKLADFGARVIKIESSDGDATRRFGPPFLAGESAYFMAYNRGKESVVVDMRTPEGREVVERLLRHADVLIDNFRPGVLERIGLDAARIAAIAPEIVHVTITGYGSRSPRADEPAFDLAVQAECGMMKMTGPESGEPCRVPFSACDVAAGEAAAQAVLAALYARERGVGGARIEVPLMDAAIASLGYQTQSTLMTSYAPERLGHRHPNLAPYQAFATADGAMVLAVATDAQWRALAAVESMPADLAAPRWCANADRVSGREELAAILADVLAAAETTEWLTVFRARGIPAAALRGLDDALTDYRRRGDDLLDTRRHAKIGDMEVVTSPILVGGQRAASSSAAPSLGEHGEAVISWLADLDEVDAETRARLCRAVAGPTEEGTTR